jgi:hypothetical protein
MLSVEGECRATAKSGKGAPKSRRAATGTPRVAIDCGEVRAARPYAWSRDGKPGYGRGGGPRSGGTDRHRLDSYTYALLANQNTLYAGYPWRFTKFRKTNGYANMPLDGIWLRAPYLHNGSVPSLRDLMEPPENRPQSFYRGNDVFDQIFERQLRGLGRRGDVFVAISTSGRSKNILAALKAAQRRTNAYAKAIVQAEAALNKRAKRRKR